jgi:cell division cycle protein 20 (cofactor of APC complex)
MNNIILDSIFIKKDSLIESLDLNIKLEKKNRILSFTKNTQNNDTLIKRKNSNPISRKKSTNTITDIKYLYEKNINDFNELQNDDNELYITRNIQLEPERILDAPNLIDDYYLNLLDWGSNNILSICLSNNVYLWNSLNCNTNLLTTDTDNENFSGISFMNNNGNCLAIGKNNGNTEIWDIEKSNKIRTLDGHNGRVTSLAWNGYLLSSGGKDSVILNHDVRIKEHIVNKMINGHNKEICNLKWDNEYNYLASGGNDNMVCIWDVKKTNNSSSIDKKNSIWNILNSPIKFKDNINNDINPLFIFNNHIAAVKAISWCPFKRNLLISGGGKKDNSIKFWNIDEGKLINSFDTGSQVCQLLWNKVEKEIISSHGFNKNSINIWTYPKMYKVAELNGHMNRVLYICISPDDVTLASGSSDETLRFWIINDREKVNERMKKKNRDGEFGIDDMFCNMNIR